MSFLTFRWHQISTVFNMHQRSKSKQTPTYLLFTTQLSLANLPENERHCPICKEAYQDRNETTPTKSCQNATPRAATPSVVESEAPLRVDLSASNTGSSRLCGHAFGGRCLEKLITSRGSWNNKCPLCRCEWFAPAPAASLQATAEERTPRCWRNILEGIMRRNHRSDIGEGGRGNGINGGGYVGDVGDSSRRIRRSTGAFRHVLEHFGITDEKVYIDKSADEVEKALERLYHMLEGNVEEYHR